MTAAVMEYRVATTLAMTLRQLKLVATIVPICAVLVLEAVRFVIVGPLPLRYRIALDTVAVAAIAVFSTIIFRFVDRMQHQ